MQAINRIFEPPPLSQSQAHPYKEHGNEIRKDLAETRSVTFLMVFLIQNTQNRDTDILHLKIDELLRVTKDAQNAMLGLEALDLKQLEALRKQYRRIGESETIAMDVPPSGGQPKSRFDQC
ncbi:Low affinity iron permease [Pseudomonas prosekii]|uniref:Low affinity iron permease n=1 Tax=Pseudomonas prosekii TaxID=1148509 RepID=A0A1H1R8A0_9PSED|nr:Low affinity iron permease [Pseudomonas prosekii]